jgi:membrane protein implicated in regulation of membrane protease activity
VSSKVGRSRPLVISAGVFLLGTILGGVLWAVGLTWALSTEGSAPTTALVLIWLAVAAVAVSWLTAALVARPKLVARLRHSDRESQRTSDSIRKLTGAVEQISQSVHEAPSRSDLDGQISRARGQIEGRLDAQQRSIDRIVRRVATDTGVASVQQDAGFALVGGGRPRNVFVLGTGRCGTVTLSAACGHFDNYTSGHESLRGELSAARFAYPDHHIESDNRLSWFLGELGRRFDDDETLYVHLTRSPEDVIASYARRWGSGFRSNIGRAFGHGIVIRTEDWPESEVESVIRFYVETVTTNIETFLEGRSSMAMQLESIQTQFPDFVDRIGATGDLEAAKAELHVKHNASRTNSDSALVEDVVESDVAPGELQPEAAPRRLD